MLLLREFPDPPVEVDPDRDDEESKTNEQTTTLSEGKIDNVNDDENDPTTRPWAQDAKGQ